MAGEAGPRRRVLLFTSSPLEGSEGADKRLATLIAQSVPGAEFTWFTQWPRAGAPRLAGGRPVPIVSRNGMPGALEQAQVTVAGAVLSRRADLVHAVVTVGWRFPLLSRAWPRLFPRCPVIHTIPGIVDPRLPARARPLGITVALCEATAAQLRDAGFPDVRVIPPAVCAAAWPCRPRHPGPATVLFAGHSDPGGGAAEAIATAAAARECGAEFRLVLAIRSRPGKAPGAGLGELCRRYGLGDAVILGHVADMPGLLSAADVLLFTPRVLAGKADIPLTVLEALATGRPVIISDLPQFAALGDAVVRAPAGDARQAAALLTRLLSEPRWWASAAGRGRAAVVSRFGPQRFAARYRALYREAAG
jgi:glycosyltransferase involved in cell wall biosynthesis